MKTVSAKNFLNCLSISEPLNLGTFDGSIGMLQRNESDFTVFSVPLESLQGNFEFPVKILGLVSQHDYFILSHPYYNRLEAMTLSDIAESILIIDPGVVAFYSLLFLVTLLIITKICDQMHWSPSPAVKTIETQRKVVNGRVKLIPINNKAKSSGRKIFWEMSRFFPEQGSEFSFDFFSQMIFYVTFACAVGVLINLYRNHMNADLVTYKKPILLDSLQDIWNAGNTVNITFIAASSAAGVFKRSSKRSIQRLLYDRSVEQWKDNSPNFHLFPSNLMLMGPSLIKHGANFFSSPYWCSTWD